MGVSPLTGLPFTTVLALSLTVIAADSQKARKLGPETVTSIQEAKLDPAFQTSPKNRLILLPFANTSEFAEAASVIAKNLVSQLGQKHPEYTVVSPEDLINFVSNSKLDDQFNVFLGDYLASSVARQDFLTTLHTKLQADGVLVGRIVAYGQVRPSNRLLGTTSYIVGMELSWYRVSDGRRIWWGKDTIDARKATNLKTAAEAMAEVFARFVGRSAYQ